MTKKLFVLVALIALVSGGAFAQLAFGVTGALPMSQQLGASEIATDFKTGNNIYYGGFVELLGKHFGLGVSANFSPTNGTFDSVPTKFLTWDGDLYLSYHLFRATGFFDPFLEVGGGLFALSYYNDTPAGQSSLLAASPYWYGALGLGINLGHHLGIFGKFAYNMAINNQINQSTPLYYYYDSNSNKISNIPEYRFTLGLKIIL
jgi:hypothetical protein